MASGCTDPNIEQLSSTAPAASERVMIPDPAPLLGVHGPPKELGIAKFAGTMVSVTQYGPIMAGAEGHFYVDVGRAEVDGVYLWIGSEDDGKKRRWPAQIEPEGYHAHPGVPRPLREGAELWIELKLKDGTRDRRSFSLATD